MDVLAHGLEDLGLLPVSAEEALSPDSKVYARWTLHSTSHMLGMDVHDCAAARPEAYTQGDLAEGMVLTVEPGLYFQEDDLLVPEEMRGIGIRIEDDILVTADGTRNLSARCRASRPSRSGWPRGPRSSASDAASRSAVRARAERGGRSRAPSSPSSCSRTTERSCGVGGRRSSSRPSRWSFALGYPSPSRTGTVTRSPGRSWVPSGMDLLLLLLLVAVSSGWSPRSRRRHGPAGPAPRSRPPTSTRPRRAAEEDVTRFGEELQRLDLDVQMAGVDEAMLQDWQRALDSYEAAKRSLEMVQAPDDVRHVTTALEDGRYAVACVRARRDGKPLPVRRPPCFFNPSHGPSTVDVDWSPPGGQPRRIPVCGADADRLAQGAEPDIRTVPQGAGRVPYWHAGPAYSPWAMGYFSMYAATGLLPAFMLGSLLASDWDGAPADGFDTGGDGGTTAGTAAATTAATVEASTGAATPPVGSTPATAGSGTSATSGTSAF